MLRRLRQCRRQAERHIGVNVGANKDSDDRIADYALGIEVFYDVADYFTVNISSPNTPGLRDLHARDNLAALMEAVCGARERQMAAGKPRRALFLKIAPDLGEEEMDHIAEEIRLHPLDGTIVSNTTLARHGLAGTTCRRGRRTVRRPAVRTLDRHSCANAPEAGARAHAHRAGRCRQRPNGAGEDPRRRGPGAALYRLHFEGPGLIGQMLRELSDLVAGEKVDTIADLRDGGVDEWAAKTLPVG